MSTSRRFALRLQFEGAGFAGTAVQPGQRTVQDSLQAALQNIDPHHPNCTPASRLDAGVSAFAWTCHVDCERHWHPNDLLKACNGNLPSDVRVVAAAAVADSWHARYESHQKTYRYTWQLGPVAPTRDTYWWQARWSSTGLTNIRAFCEAIRGSHDLTAFAVKRSTDTDDSATNQRVISQADLALQAPLPYAAPSAAQTYHLIVSGSGFFYRQVRGLAGTIAALGRDSLALPEAVAAIDAGWQVRPLAPIAPAAPLCLINTAYSTEPDWVVGTE
jgi:tRNA pseudouridine38-40 synthase